HQELLLTDILHAFYTNPLKPVYVKWDQALESSKDRSPGSQKRDPGHPGLGRSAKNPLRFVEFAGGLVDVGFTGSGFCYDNELPRHRVWLEPYRISNRLVSN